jgi:Protein of unknown function (DUF3300)
MERNRIRAFIRALALVAVGVVAGCGSKPPPAAAPAPVQPSTPAAETVSTVEVVPAVRPLEVTGQTWTAEAMEALLAPIALYPDPVLSQVLMAATNPQEVLDAGNWLIDHPGLADKDLDLAASAAGFTPPMRALMQFRQVVDQMCLKMGWTAELGQAFTNDQAGVLGAVQRLRRQAQDAGHLENSPQMAVETQEQGDQKVIVIAPPNPQVVYVPQYDPTTAYAPAPAPEDSGYYSDTWASTGVLVFGAGLIVGNVFDGDGDDYYHHRYYYPDYRYGRYPPCPPRQYRPGYGYRPGHYYNRPPHYDDRLRDHHLLVDDRGGGDDYWGHFDERPTNQGRAESVPSPITVARMPRPEPVQFSPADGAPAGRVETTTEIFERPRGDPRHAPETGVAGPPPEARDRDPRYGDRGERRREITPGPQLLGDNEAPPASGVVRERHHHGGDHEPLGVDRPQPQPRQTAPTLSGDGRRGKAGPETRDAGGGQTTGLHAQDGARPPARTNPRALVAQPQQR